MDSHQLPSHSSAISSYVFNVAPKILGMQGPVVFVAIRYGSVGLKNRKTFILWLLSLRPQDRDSRSSSGHRLHPAPS